MRLPCRLDNDHIIAFGGAKNTQEALTTGTAKAAQFTPAFNLSMFQAILAPAIAPGKSCMARESSWILFQVLLIVSLKEVSCRQVNSVKTNLLLAI